VSTTPPLRLNPTLRPNAFRPVFKAHRRLHIPEVLNPASARALHAALTDAKSWIRSVHLQAGQDVDITMDELNAMTEAERTELENNLVDSSTDSVKYVFDAVRITPAIKEGRSVPKPLRAIHDFVNGRNFLELISRITGDERVAFADVMATRYMPGHFATAHADELPGHRRLYAYVLNLTPEWRADWGGVLTFLDDDGHIAEGYVPKFNALNIFEVPQTHAVSVVSRLARAPRLSVTGWIHARQGGSSNGA